MLNERVFELNDVTATHAAEDTRASRTFVFITWAVEIEGEAPLYFSIEAVDE
jgi:hypothetical protein